MASRAEILSATKSKGNKKSTLAQRGRWNSTNSGAFLRAPSVAVGPGAPGSSEKAKANFLNAIIKDVIPAAKKVKDQKDKEQVNFGKASWVRATKDQREKWAFAIKNGHAFEGDSPYFRYGVSVARTESMAGKYSQETFQKYEKWKDKNDPESGSFDEWLNSHDETWQSSFEHIDDEILANHFLPMQAQVRDRLRTQHTQRLNENYRTESYYEKQNEVFTKLRNYFGSIAEEGTQDPTMGFGPLIVRGKEGNQYNVETIGMVKALLDKKNPTEADFMKVPNGPAMWKRYSALSSKKRDMLNEKNAVSVMDSGSMTDLSVDAFYKENNSHFMTISSNIGSEEGSSKTYFDFIRTRMPKLFNTLDKKGKDDLTLYLEIVNKTDATKLQPNQKIVFNSAHFVKWRKNKSGKK